MIQLKQLLLYKMMMELDQMMMISILDLQMVMDMLNLLQDQLLTLNQHPILMLIQLLSQFQKNQHLQQ